ncbi:DUF6069 family protein [Actinomadura rupiterrae]|uniref:DUF6069 family protein n=1 Tax=Actinomadura rupiterrae TaxID=559627 RepID=UPI0020A284C3|nr:DUF6069 family protein [Actinomadura rupiterrae]MCP2342180.1 hypothetical protein [Actinomadura rupiterrae]
MSIAPAAGATVTGARRRVPMPVLLKTSAFATVLAAAAIETLTALVRAAGIRLEVGDPGGSAADLVPVGAGACTIALVMCMIPGTVLAVLINRYGRRPVRTYRITTSALVLVSLLPPLAAAATSTGTKATLIATHLLAAAIIVPITSRKLAHHFHME